MHEGGNMLLMKWINSKLWNVKVWSTEATSRRLIYDLSISYFVTVYIYIYIFYYNDPIFAFVTIAIHACKITRFVHIEVSYTDCYTDCYENFQKLT